MEKKMGFATSLVVVDAVLAAVDGAIAALAFLQLLRFHFRNQQLGWTRQKAKDEEEDDDNGSTDSLLEKPTTKTRSLHVDGRRRCCSCRNIHVGSRQKFVLLAILLTFILMIAFTLLIWGGRGNKLTEVYQYLFSVAMLLLGVALACYGFLLFSKMSRVRSEMASAETWKVAGLAAVTLVCFTSCSVLGLVAKIRVLIDCHSDRPDRIISSVFLFLYYFVGLSVPSVFVLWIMREMPPPVVPDRPPRSTVVTFVRDSIAHNPQWRTAVASSQNRALKASPI